MTRCPFCLWPLDDSGPLTTCTECDTRYHADCWGENGGCATFGCAAWTRAQFAATTPPPPPAGWAPPTAPAQRPPPYTPPNGAVHARGLCQHCASTIEAGDHFCASCGGRVG